MVGKVAKFIKRLERLLKGFFVVSDAVIFLFLKRDWAFELDKVIEVWVK